MKLYIFFTRHLYQCQFLINLEPYFHFPMWPTSFYMLLRSCTGSHKNSPVPPGALKRAGWKCLTPERFCRFYPAELDVGFGIPEFWWGSWLAQFSASLRKEQQGKFLSNLLLILGEADGEELSNQNVWLQTKKALLVPNHRLDFH